MNHLASKSQFTPSRLVAALLFAVLLSATAVWAGSGDAEERIKIKVMGDSAGMVEADVEDMAVGETRVLTTDDGKQVQLTRTEDGFDLDVDGKQIQIGDLHGDHSWASADGASVNVDSEDVEVIKIGGSGHGHDEDVRVIKVGGSGHGKKIWISEDGDTHHLGEGGKAVVIVDGEVIEMGEGEGHRIIKKKIRGEGHGGEHEIEIEMDGEEGGEGRRVMVIQTGDEGGKGTKIRKRIVIDGDSEEVLHVGGDGEDVKVFIVGDGEEGGSHRVIRKKVIIKDGSGEGEDGERIEIRIEKKVEVEEDGR